VESQRLLMPEVVELSAAESAVATEAIEALASFGFEIREFGERTVAVHAVPSLLADCDPKELLHDVIEELNSEGEARSAKAQRERLARAVACKAAIKAGQRLRESEIEALLARREALGERAETCPHGRPTALVFSLEEMERRFKRK